MMRGCNSLIHFNKYTVTKSFDDIEESYNEILVNKMIIGNNDFCCIGLNQYYDVVNNTNNYVIIMNRMKCDLYDLHCIDKMCLIKLIVDVLSSIKYLHKYMITHADIHERNIMYDDIQNKFVIIDFGECLIVKNSNKYTPSFMHDIFEFGCTLSRIILRKIDIPDVGEFRYYNEILNNLETLSNMFGHNVINAILNMVKCIDERLYISDLLKIVNNEKKNITSSLNNNVLEYHSNIIFDVVPDIYINERKDIIYDFRNIGGRKNYIYNNYCKYFSENNVLLHLIK